MGILSQYRATPWQKRPHLGVASVDKVFDEQYKACQAQESYSNLYSKSAAVVPSILARLGDFLAIVEQRSTSVIYGGGGLRARFVARLE